MNSGCVQCFSCLMASRSRWRRCSVLEVGFGSKCHFTKKQWINNLLNIFFAQQVWASFLNNWRHNFSFLSFSYYPKNSSFSWEYPDFQRFLEGKLRDQLSFLHVIHTVTQINIWFQVNTIYSESNNILYINSLRCEYTYLYSYLYNRFIGGITFK